MKIRYHYATVLAALLSSAVHAKQPSATIPAGAALNPDNCTACHQGGMSLGKYESDELEQRILALRSNSAGHPPVQLEQAGEDDIKRLAATLSTDLSEQ